MKKYLLFYIILSCPFYLLSQEGFTTKTVTVFKNNSGFFMKSGNIQPKNNHHIFDLESLPKAAYGTFWLSNKNILHLTSYEQEKISVKASEHLEIPNGNRDFLKKNKGKSAQLFLGEEQSFQGKIKETTDNLVFMELENGEFLSIPVDHIRYVLLKEKPNDFETINKSDTTKTKKRIVQLQFKNNDRQDLELIYFQQGIGWTPSYKIELQEDSKAKMTMQAALFNQAEDIENVDINFVVGYPNIKYANDLAVLFQDKNLNRALTQSGGINYLQLTDRARRGGANVYYEGDLFGGGSPSGSENANNLKSVAEEDLYFYNLKNISLPKGGRGYFSIFETTVSYEDLYEVNLVANHNNYYAYQPVDYKDEYRNKVWHILRLENSSNHPWTTGAAMVVKRDGNVIRPISQDDLNYTPMKGKGKLKLTISPDVSVKDYEKEKQRTTRQLEKDGYYYEIVTITGEVKIQNFKSEDIQLNIKKTIVGNLLTSDPDWLKNARVNIQIPYNKINEVCWELALKAGERKVVKYEYQVYVRR